MPAALTVNQNFAGLFVDQSLVDEYLARVNRFVNNVNTFENTLNGLLNRSKPIVSEMETPVYQEAATEPAQNIVTADDINIDDLLKGIDLGGGISL